MQSFSAFLKRIRSRTSIDSQARSIIVRAYLWATVAATRPTRPICCTLCSGA